MIILRNRLHGPARRQVLVGRAPAALPRAHDELEHAAPHKELVRDPAPGPRLSVERRALDVLGLVRRVKVDHPDDGPLAVPGPELDLAEEGRREEVHVLPGHGEEAHHGQPGKRPHGAVVVARDPREGGVEQAGDVPVRPVRAEPGAPGVVELEHRQEGLLVAHVDDARLVEVVEPLGEELGPAHGADERGHVLQHVEAVQPRAALVRAHARVQVAPVHLVHGAARPRVVVLPAAVDAAHLQEALPLAPHVLLLPELLVGPHIHVPLVCVPQVAPVAAALHVLAVVVLFAQPFCQQGYGEVVVRVLDRPRDAARDPARAVVVDVVVWDVAELVVADEVAAPFRVPAQRLLLCVRDNRCVRCLPVYAVGDSLQEGIRDHNIGVGSTLREALTKGHAAIRKLACTRMSAAAQNCFRSDH